MALPLDLIDTIVVVIMEERSFDHLLGSLTLCGANPGVDGLQNTPCWMQAHANRNRAAVSENGLYVIDALGKLLDWWRIRVT
jgi:phospholipase C